MEPSPPPAPAPPDGERGLLGWGLVLLGVLLGRSGWGRHLLRRPVRRLQLRYLDWPLQRVALALLTRRRDGSWFDRVPAELAPDTHPAFFGGRDDATATLAGYRAGFYPMPEPCRADARLRRTALDVRGLPWHSPAFRAITPAGGALSNKSLRRSMRNAGWTTTIDAAFDEVVEQCVRPESDTFWLTPRHRATWEELHRRGHAHSLEVWEGEELAGGLFFLQVGGLAWVASLFHHRSNASKVADLDLNARLHAAGGAAVDGGGFWYDYFESVGVQRMPRAEFLAMLRRTRDDDVRLETGRLPASRLAAS